jgi:hypothetical protein
VAALLRSLVAANVRRLSYYESMPAADEPATPTVVTAVHVRHEPSENADLILDDPEGDGTPHLVFAVAILADGREQELDSSVTTVEHYGDNAEFASELQTWVDEQDWPAAVNAQFNGAVDYSGVVVVELEQ